MSVATAKTLTALHARLATAMSEALDAETRRIQLTQELYETDLTLLDEGTANAVSNAISLAPSARVDNGLLKTISAFLKDNSITAELGRNEEEDEAAATLRALKAKRKVAQTPLDTIQ